MLLRRSKKDDDGQRNPRENRGKEKKKKKKEKWIFHRCIDALIAKDGDRTEFSIGHKIMGRDHRFALRVFCNSRRRSRNYTGGREGGRGGRAQIFVQLRRV